MDPKECVLTNQDRAQDVTHLLLQFLERQARENPMPTMEPKKRLPPTSRTFWMFSR